MQCPRCQTPMSYDGERYSCYCGVIVYHKETNHEDVVTAPSKQPACNVQANTARSAKALRKTFCITV